MQEKESKKIRAAGWQRAVGPTQACCASKGFNTSLAGIRHCKNLFAGFVPLNHFDLGAGWSEHPLDIEVHAVMDGR